MADTTRKTQPTAAEVGTFLGSVENDARREDASAVVDVMREITGVEPVMWGTSIIGFGRLAYTTADGKEHETFAVGLSPRKAALTLYGLTFYGTNEELLGRLGPHTTGKGCVYVKRLDEVDREVLAELIQRSWETNHVG